MSSVGARHVEGITLRQAAVIAGIAYFLFPTTYAEFKLYPALVVSGNVAQTIHNIQGNGNEFGVAILCYLINYILDVVIAWALYILLVPVNQALSLLTALFRLIYTGMGLVGVLQLAMVFRLVNGHYGALFGPSQLRAQVELLLESFRYGWAFSLIVFGIHLLLLGYLIYRAAYVLYGSSLIPKILGVLLALDGVGWMVSGLRPYLYPNANLGWFFVVSFAELLLPLWLLTMGWRIKLRPEESYLTQ
jgi:hypothetical protein